MKDYSVQTVQVIVDNRDGSRVEIGPDPDNPEWVRICMGGSLCGASESEMSFPREQAALVAEALAKAAS